MLPILGSGRNKTTDPEREPLLPQHTAHIHNGSAASGGESDPVPPVLTAHQKSLDEKLHTYLMLRALSRGYLPSTDQFIAMLRKLLASELLARDNPHLTTDGQKLVQLIRKLDSQVIELASTKNGRDQLQDFLSAMKKARLNVDLEGLGNAVSNAKTTNARAAYNSLSTITSLLMQNSDFNKLFADATTIVRQVVASSASTAADYADKAASQIEPSNSALETVGSPPLAEGSEVAPRKEAVEENRQLIEQLEETAVEGAKKTKDEAVNAFDEAMTPERERALKARVREMIRNMRKNADYQTSVSTVSILLKQYLMTYSTAVEDAAEEVTEDIRPNKALNRAGALLWSVLTSFGDKAEWDKLKEKVDKLMTHKDRDPDLEGIITKLVDSLHRLLTDPNYLFEENDDGTGESFVELKKNFHEMSGPEEVKQDLDAVIRQMGRTWKSIWGDTQVLGISSTCASIVSLMFQSSDGGTFNRALLSDVFHVLLPLALESIQFIPVPRITLLSPDLDLLLEPLILEPGRTVNQSSFLPYNVGIVTTNEFNVFKGRRKVNSNAASSARVNIQGITVKAEGVGYVMKFHKNWLFRFTDSGIASFKLDEKGIDIGLDLEFTRSLADHVVMLKGVSVKLHKLDFTLKRSKFSFLAWIMRPFVRPILRKLLEKSLRDAIETALRTANNELVYTRERLRATRIADPQDFTTFIRAVLARWHYPYADDEEVDLRVGWRARGPDGRQEGPFDGVYAPGSLVGLMETEGAEAGERVEEGDMGGWRNECFDI